MLKVHEIPALHDNYIWALVLDKNTVIVDPGEAKPVISYLENSRNSLCAILITHHHYDHTGGVEGLLNYQDVPVYGPASIPQVTHPLTLSTFYLEPINQTFSIIGVPGHTLEHIAYYTPGLVLTGDTLFTGGCGKIFEGSTEQMLQSLNQLKALPDDTLVYCGHEYTEANLKFALMVEPNNKQLINRMQAVRELRSSNKPTVPAILAIEKATNPFLRCDKQEVIDAVCAHEKKSLTSEVSVLKALREWKNQWG